MHTFMCSDCAFKPYSRFIAIHTERGTNNFQIQHFFLFRLNEGSNNNCEIYAADSFKL